VEGGGGGGGGGGGATAPDTLTPSKVPVVGALLALQTTRPTSALLAMFNVVLPTVVQVLPFDETDAVTVVPLRVSLSHAGGGCVAVPRNVVVAPVADRVMNSIAPFGRTSSTTLAALGDSDSRSITPAFAKVLVFWRLVT
jgi:hypothetical protein